MRDEPSDPLWTTLCQVSRIGTKPMAANGELGPSQPRPLRWGGGSHLNAVSNQISHPLVLAVGLLLELTRTKLGLSHYLIPRKVFHTP